MGSALSTGWGSVPSIRDFAPPTPEAYALLITVFQYFPLVTIFQWLLSWYPAGKTSLKSSVFNLPGRIAWCAMEIVGPINLIYNLAAASPSLTQLPLSNQVLAGMYCCHYLNRAIISPFYSAPSMSPIHFFIMSSAIAFNWFNSSCLAGWLRGYPTPIVGLVTDGAAALSPSTSATLVEVLSGIGAFLFCIGMAGNIYSEKTLFRLRIEEGERRAAKKSDTNAGPTGNKYSKVYVIPPPTGVFRSILYPHFAFEWLEWAGFALAGVAVFPLGKSAGLGTPPPLKPAPWLLPAAWASDRLGVPLPLPAVMFVVNAVANMLPHARWGRKWYVEKFGEKDVAGRGAVVPWCSLL
ncbi:hypothetical protein N7468_005281 [Penicillium chermesinum]|uniref:3-oxo-5-alpha-steroid 4-dehydrogenase C-terminal domain-containing protein n=1 Tax=Penicillium chermesinum TaxID=63820 RepID=A0A9W9NZ46_9EURO|nr:uncharacterized protein N7468_005281 [Penicillium chermesinum]KAJ5232325.1 hypothetical protein N7468_005281 [Penicillium chermesinum]